MNFDPSSIDGPPSAPTPRPTGRVRETAAPDVPAAVGGHAIPSSPPPQVRVEVERAARRYDELRAEQRHLHFEVSERRVRVEVQALDGTVLRRIPASSALDIASGGPI